MIKVKENLTPEQIKQFSETREFGIIDNIKRGARNLVTKAAKRDFQAGVIYLERTWNSRSGRLSFIVKYKSVDKSKSLSDVNNDANELMKNMKAELAKGSDANRDDDVVERIPIKIFKGEDAEAYKEDIKAECERMMMSNTWFNAQIKL